MQSRPERTVASAGTRRSEERAARYTTGLSRAAAGLAKEPAWPFEAVEERRFSAAEEKRLAGPKAAALSVGEARKPWVAEADVAGEEKRTRAPRAGLVSGSRCRPAWEEVEEVPQAWAEESRSEEAQTCTDSPLGTVAPPTILRRWEGLQASRVGRG